MKQLIFRYVIPQKIISISGIATRKTTLKFQISSPTTGLTLQIQETQTPDTFPLWAILLNGQPMQRRKTTSLG